MHFATALLLVMAAGPVKLAAPGLTYVGLDEKAADAYVEFFADQLRGQRLDVTTRGQIAALLGFERQKQLIGCDDAAKSSCLAELAGALGVDGLITGSLNRTARGSFVITLTVVAATDGRTVVSASQRLADEDALYDFLTRFAQEQGRKISSQLAAGARAPADALAATRANVATATDPSRTPTAGSLPPMPPAPRRGKRPSESPGGSDIHPGWFVAAAGAVSLVAGGIVYGVAAGRHGQLARGEVGVTDFTDLQDQLNVVGSQQTLAAFLAAGGVVAAGGGAGWALLSRPPQLALTPTGATVSLSWVLP